MNFKSKQVNNTLTVAEVFSAARKEKGEELEKIEKATKISKKYLQALEDGNYKILPSTVYTKNFAKTYAEFLDLDVEQIIEMIERELGIITKINDHQKEEKSELDYLNSKILVTPTFIRNIIVTLLVIACLAYLGWQVNAIFSLPPLTIYSPEPDLITDNNFITVEGKTLPEIDLTINNQKILTDQDGKFATEIDLQSGLNTIEIRAKKKHSKASVETRQVMLQTVEIVEGENPPENENLLN